MREKRHCCCCVPLPDGVMLVGIYGTTFHTGLLVIQVSLVTAANILLIQLTVPYPKGFSTPHVTCFS